MAEVAPVSDDFKVTATFTVECSRPGGFTQSEHLQAQMLVDSLHDAWDMRLLDIIEKDTRAFVEKHRERLDKHRLTRLVGADIKRGPFWRRGWLP
jgi:hypothetical protein